MARARNIKPGFFRNADLVELSFEARLLFIGLWTIADRAGRLEDRPKQIKMELFPADNLDVDALLEQLAAIGMVARYSHEGKRYLQVVNFAKHQNPHKDERASTIPDQDGNVATPDVDRKKHGAGIVQAPCEAGGDTVAAGLIPDSLIPDTSPTGESAAEPLRTPGRKKSEARTLQTYLAECKAAAAKPIPDDHHVRAWAADAGIQPEMLQIAWVLFRERYTDGEKGKGKRYKDWPGHFATAVKGNWFKLWFADGGAMSWTGQGLTHKTVLDARMAQREADHASA